MLNVVLDVILMIFRKGKVEVTEIETDKEKVILIANMGA